MPTTLDVAGAMCGVVVVTELVRRLAGWFMFALILLAVLYMKFGAPDWLFYVTAPKSWELMAMNFWLETTGAMGFALSVMLQNVTVFILFGVIIQATGAADAILKIAMVTTRSLRGGPAHAAIVSSAMFGTFSGSAAANVVGTGTFTIPLIKSRGFSPRFAGGIEAAASTGGQITPPVMGAAAFYLAEQAQVPYSQVAIAVLIPAMFYFASLFVAVELQARKNGIQVDPGDFQMRITREDWIKSLSFFAPLAAIIYCLWAGFSVNRAGFWAIFMTIAFGLLNRDFRNDPGQLIKKIIEGGISIGQLLAIVAGLGVFIGVVEGTGLGPKIGTDLALLVEDNIFIALLLTMVASLVLIHGHADLACLCNDYHDHGNFPDAIIGWKHTNFGSALVCPLFWRSVTGDAARGIGSLCGCPDSRLTSFRNRNVRITTLFRGFHHTLCLLLSPAAAVWTGRFRHD